MESTSSLSPSPSRPLKCCDCGCSCSVMNRSLSGTYIQSGKRKFGEEHQFKIPGFDIPQNARVEIGDECVALREMVSKQQATIQDLLSELEEERNASASAANEAMSMILRLQREKAEIQMESKQFKRYTEEKTVHEQQEMVSLEDLLYKREQAIQSLTCEVRAYKHRMMSYGLTEVEAEGEKTMSRNSSLSENLAAQFEFPPYKIYPPLICNSHSLMDGDDAVAEKENHAFEETPRSHHQFKDLESRINKLEKTPRATNSPKYGSSFKKTELSHVKENSKTGKGDNASEGDDDRIYTIDSIYQGASPYGAMDLKAHVAPSENLMMTPRESLNHSHVRDIDIQKLYARLHALEVDRESMSQRLISMGTDKAQLILLKEIAQNLCKETSPARSLPVRKQSVVGKFSVMSVFKWIASFVFWRRKAHRCRYTFGLSENNAGLLILLDRSLQAGQRRCTTSRR